MPKLVYHDSDGVDKTLTLSDAPVTVGRASDCEVRTHDAMVSRKHASITWDGSGYFIEDLGSSNGVFLGTEKVQRAPFRPGDVVTCGSLVLRMLPTAAREPTPEVRVTAATARGLEIDHAALDAGMESSAVRTNEKQVRADSEAVRLKNDLRRETERREQAEAALLAAEKKAAAADGVSREVIQLRRHIEQLEAKAPLLDLEDIGEAVAVFNDALAQLKITLRACADESALLTTPAQSAQLVRDSLHTGMEELEGARDRLREMSRKLGLR
jgi:pSer/pThr/pTyr-binding forkhead associated (FHA) protein